MTNLADARAAEALALLNYTRASAEYEPARDTTADQLFDAMAKGLKLTLAEVDPWIEANVPDPIRTRYAETRAALDAAHLATLTASASDAAAKAATVAAEPSLRRELDRLRNEVKVLYLLAVTSGIKFERDRAGRIVALEAPA